MTDSINAPRKLLEQMINLTEYWINKSATRGMSESEYKTWLALGHHSKHLLELKDLLAKPADGYVPTGVTNITRSMGRILMRFDTSEHLNDFYYTVRDAIAAAPKAGDV